MKTLRIFLVLLFILGYAAIVIYCCVTSILLDDKSPSLFEPLTYITNALCGLIGGVVAVGFGVETPEFFRESKSRYKYKMSALGNLLVTWRLRFNEDDSDCKEKLGKIYAWVYCIVGLGAIVIWVIDDVPHVLVKNIATVSFGLFIVVVKSFFDNG